MPEQFVTGLCWGLALLCPLTRAAEKELCSSGVLGSHKPCVS